MKKFACAAGVALVLSLASAGVSADEAPGDFASEAPGARADEAPGALADEKCETSKWGEGDELGAANLLSPEPDTGSAQPCEAG